jgi:uncharacterized protein (DUF1786 family)
MQVLTVDIGTGTQDIFLYDSRLDLENGYKLVLPSPTMIVHRRLREATRRREAVLLSGVTMGGGPSAWAAEDHVRAGLAVYATPDAARSFNDDLTAVEAMGVRVVSDDEAAHLPQNIKRLWLRDFDYGSIRRALELFSTPLDDLAAVAVAVFDHGNAPPDVSDRKFRFDYLDERIRTENRLSAFAYLDSQVPPSMTRLQAVVGSARQDPPTLPDNVPLIIMDTAPAAVLGATYDQRVASRTRNLIANVGNFHTLAFRLGPGGIEGVFEHHTGLIDLPRLEALLSALASGSLTNAEVFGSQGHGALIYEPQPLSLEEGGFGVAVTGPRRRLMADSSLRPYYAVPFGDMMIAGCIGLLSATADLLPNLAEPIHASLFGKAASAQAPWDIYR